MTAGELASLLPPDLRCFEPLVMSGSEGLGGGAARLYDRCVACAAQPFLRFAALMSVALALAACRSHPAMHAAPSGTAAVHPDAPAPVSAQAVRASAAASAGPSPSVRVAIAPAPGGEVAFSVQNRAPSVVELAPALSVEQSAEQGFRALPGAEVALRAEAPGERCVQLAPGAELQPAPWRSAQASAGQGTYRFVLHGCDRSYRIDSEPFELK